MDELDLQTVLQTFHQEAAERLAFLQEALVELEARPESKEQLAGIFRAAHSLKGDALCVGYEGVGELAHAFEELLERVRSGTLAFSSEAAALCLEARDALAELVAAAAAGNDELTAAHRALADRLLAHAAGERAAPETPAAAAPGPADDEAARAPAGPRTLRVTTEKLDRMLNLTGEIAVARAQLQQRLESRADPFARALLDDLHGADRLHLELQELVMRARMVPVGPVFRQHLRTVRDLAASRGRQARLVIEDEDVEVDTTVVDRLRDPLLHMIRNAVDHGLEPAEERRAAGKDPCGTVTLRARHEAGGITIEVQDDGRGLDRAGIARKARALGHDPEALDDRALCELIFEPGFTTAGEVSSVSGRGVGMDVVRRDVEALRGTVALRSQPGLGCTITIRLPLTLAIIDGFRVGVAEATYVVPLDVVTECLELPPEERVRPGARGVLNLRGAALPFLRLRELFAHQGTPPARENVVVVRYAEGSAGLVVDSLLGESQTVIKPLGRLFKRIPGVAGSAILGSGRVALILDVPGLLSRALGNSAVPGAAS